MDKVVSMRALTMPRSHSTRQKQMQTDANKGEIARNEADEEPSGEPSGEPSRDPSGDPLLAKHLMLFNLEPDRKSE